MLVKHMEVFFDLNRDPLLFSESSSFIHGPYFRRPWEYYAAVGTVALSLACSAVACGGTPRKMLGAENNRRYYCDSEIATAIAAGPQTPVPGESEFYETLPMLQRSTVGVAFSRLLEGETYGDYRGGTGFFMRGADGGVYLISASHVFATCNPYYDKFYDLFGRGSSIHIWDPFIDLDTRISVESGALISATYFEDAYIQCDMTLGGDPREDIMAIRVDPSVVESLGIIPLELGSGDVVVGDAQMMFGYPPDVVSECQKELPFIDEVSRDPKTDYFWVTMSVSERPDDLVYFMNLGAAKYMSGSPLVDNLGLVQGVLVGSSDRAAVLSSVAIRNVIENGEVHLP